MNPQPTNRIGLYRQLSQSGTEAALLTKLAVVTAIC